MTSQDWICSQCHSKLLTQDLDYQKESVKHCSSKVNICPRSLSRREVVPLPAQAWGLESEDGQALSEDIGGFRIGQAY